MCVYVGGVYEVPTKALGWICLHACFYTALMRKLVGIHPSVCLSILPWLPGWSGVFPFLCLQLQTHWRGAWSSCRLGGGGETVQLWVCVCVCVCVCEGGREGGREGERIKISHSVLHNKLDLLQIKLVSFLLSSC